MRKRYTHKFKGDNFDNIESIIVRIKQKKKFI